MKSTKFYQYEIVWEIKGHLFGEGSQILIKRNLKHVREFIKENMPNSKIKSITRLTD